MSYKYFEHNPEKVKGFFKGKIEKRSEPFVGWRGWNIEFPDVMLRSKSADFLWETPTCTTKATLSGTLSKVSSSNPVKAKNAVRIRRDPYHDYGIYSYKSVELLNRLHSIHTEHVVGRIESSGHVIEHEYGYRAQVAVIKELWYISNDYPTVDFMLEGQSIIEKLEDRYQCSARIIPITNFLHFHIKK